jgi:hypothetical protein
MEKYSGTSQTLGRERERDDKLAICLTSENSRKTDALPVFVLFILEKIKVKFTL